MDDARQVSDDEFQAAIDRNRDRGPVPAQRELAAALREACPGLSPGLCRAAAHAIAWGRISHKEVRAIIKNCRNKIAEGGVDDPVRYIAGSLWLEPEIAAAARALRRDRDQRRRTG